MVETLSGYRGIDFAETRIVSSSNGGAVGKNYTCSNQDVINGTPVE